MPDGALRIRGRFGESAEIARTNEQNARDAAATRTTCAFCEWEFIGSALEGRENAAEHRSRLHPDALNSRRNRRTIRSPNKPSQMDEDHRAEIEAARRLRAYLHGVELTD